MSDAYGMITLAKSTDCDIDANAMLISLNDYAWANHNTEWVLSDQETFHISEMSLQYPTVFNLVLQVNPNSQCTNSDDDDDDDDDEVSLDELVTKLASHMSTGWIEISAVAHEKNRYVYYECLKIYSTGKGFRSYKFISGNETKKFVETN
jgi:hypothetical protein